MKHENSAIFLSHTHGQNVQFKADTVVATNWLIPMETNNDIGNIIYEDGKGGKPESVIFL
jgi:hypothetical protein